MSNKLKTNFFKIIEDAIHAPSVHNTQPWLIGINDNIITVEIDANHALKDGDPTGRETIISLGIFAEAIALCSKGMGLNPKKVEYKDRKAYVEIDENLIETNKNYTRLLKNRVSDRSIYKKTDLTENFIDQLSQISTSDRVKVWIKNDDNFINIVAHLTSKGISLALSSPAFRKELSRYLVLPWSSKLRGISVRSLYIPSFVAYIEPFLLRNGINLKAESVLEKRRWESSSGIACITTAGDMPEDWFEAGRTYLHLSLAIEDMGMSQATSAAIVEASDFHEDIEKQLGTTQRLQSVIRFGIGKSNKYRSPRVRAESLITT